MPPRKPTAPPPAEGEEKTEVGTALHRQSSAASERTERAASPYGAGGPPPDEDLPTGSSELEGSEVGDDEGTDSALLDDPSEVSAPRRPARDDPGAEDSRLDDPEDEEPELSNVSSGSLSIDDDDELPAVDAEDSDGANPPDREDDDSLYQVAPDEDDASAVASDIYGDEDDYPSEDKEYVEPPEEEGPRSRGGDTNPGKEPIVAPEGRDRGDPEDENENPDATKAGPPIRLQIVEGPDAGKWKKVRGVRMVVGRVAGCDLKLSDQTVSRRHLELVQGEQGVLLRDLGSGNGTKVNGEKVTERMLQHDDEIAIGKTVFRFIDEVAAFTKHRDAAEKRESSAAATGDGAKEGEGPELADGDEAAPPEEAAAPEPLTPDATRGFVERVVRPWQRLQPSQRLMALVGLGGLLLFALAFGAVMFKRRAGVVPDARIARAKEKLTQAREAAAAKRFEEAQALAAQAKALFSGAGDSRLEAEIEGGMAREVAAAVRRAISERQLEEARALLAKLPASDPLRERARLESDLRIREGEERARQADAAATQRRSEQARLERAREDRRLQEAADRAAQLEGAFVAVARKFHAGEYRRAASECDRVLEQARGDVEIRARAKALQTLIPAFGSAFEEGHRRYQAGQLVSAVKPLRRARELYLKIDFPGALGAQVDEELAAAALAAGKEALAKDDLVNAGLNLRDAAKLDPADARAKEGLERLNSKLDKLYEEAGALVKGDKEGAIARYRRVVAAAAPGTAVHERSKARLAALER